MPASDRRLQKQVNGINLAMFGKLSKQTTNETETETETQKLKLNSKWARRGGRARTVGQLRTGKESLLTG